MSANFTDKALRVMELAKQEAQRSDHEFVGSGHVLLGLQKESTGLAARVLENLEIDCLEL